MSAVPAKSSPVIRQWGRISAPIRLGVAAATVALGFGCGPLSRLGQPAQSVDFEVRNTTHCFARIYAMHRGAGTLLELDELGPGQRTVVNVPPGMRVYTRTHTNTGADPKPVDNCHRSGKVRVTRLPATT